jgi:uncharacterized protein YciI
MTMNLAWVALAVLGLAAGQTPAPSPSAPANDPTAYHAVFLKLGPKWDKARPAREQAGIQEHGQYMSTLSSSGILILGGPFVEDIQRFTASGALVFLATGDAAEARRLMEADPGVKSGLFAIDEVRRFVVSTGAWRPWKRSGP